MVALARKLKRKPVVSPRGVSNSDTAARRLRGGGAFDEFFELGNLVENENACALPGCSIVYDRFMPVLRRAMSRGYVRDAHGEFVADGLRHGFSLGLPKGAFDGVQRVFKNYASAVSARPHVTKAVQKRVKNQKTLGVGKWHAVKDELFALFAAFIYAWSHELYARV